MKQEICGNCIHYSGYWKCYMRRGGAHFDAPAICPDYEPKLEEKKMNYFMLDGRKIPMSDETAASLREEQKTYSIGDCFRVGDYDTIIQLVECDCYEVIAVCIIHGNRWADKLHVEDKTKITLTELKTLLQRDNFTPITIKMEEVQ